MVISMGPSPRPRAVSTPRNRDPLRALPLSIALLTCLCPPSARCQTSSAASIAVSPSRPLVTKGTSVQMSAVVRDGAGQVIPGAQVSWKVTAGSGSASITPGGLLTGTAIGDCDVTATSGGASATVRASVLPTSDHVIASLPPVVAKPGTSPYVHVILSSTSGATSGTATIKVVAVSPAGAPLPTFGQAMAGAAAAGGTVMAEDAGLGAVRLQVQCPNGINGPGILASVPLVFPKLSADSTYRLELSGVSLITPSGTSLPIVTQNGSLKVLVGSSGPVATIQVTPSNRTMAVGETASLAAALLDGAGNEVQGVAVQWSVVEGAGCGTVSSNGLVTATEEGTMRVRAAAGQAVGDAVITVVAAGASGVTTVLSTPLMDGTPGATVAVPVMVTDVQGLAGADVTLEFDQVTPDWAPLPYVQGVELGPMAGGSFLAINKDQPGKVSMAVMGSRDMQGPGVLFEVSLVLPTDAPGGAVYRLQIAKQYLTDAIGNKIPSASLDGAIQLPADQMPPTARISGVSPGQVVRGTIIVLADASDDSGIARVDLMVDGFSVASAPAASASLAWDTTTVADGAHTLQVRAVDGTGNSALSPAVVVTVDNSPPTAAITSPGSGNLLHGSVALRGTAADLSLRSFTVEYGAGSPPSSFRSVAPPGAASVRDGLLATVDTSTLPDGPGTFRLTVTDSVGNTATATVPVRIDNTPPSIAMAAPTDGAILRDELWASANVTDANGVAVVQLSVDGGQPTTVLQPPYRIWLNTRTLADGPHHLTVYATDSAGNAAMLNTAFVVDNTPPDVQLSLPQTPVGGAVTVAGSVSDANLDGYWLEYGKGANPLSWTRVASVQGGPAGSLGVWDTSSLDDGLYTLRVVAEDKAGNASQAVARVTLDNTPPAVLVRSPAQGSLASGTIAIDVESADASGVAAVRLVVGGLIKQEVPATSPTCRFTFDTTTLPDGQATLQLQAKDVAGNIGAADLSLRIDNTPPALAVTSPQPGAGVVGLVNVIGAAQDPSGLSEWEVEFGVGGSPQQWQTVASSSAASANGTLAVWDASHLQPGPYVLRLSATDLAGNRSQLLVPVVVRPQHTGDVTGDGTVGIADALLVLRMVLGVVPPTPELLAAGDVAPMASPAWLSGDGRLGIADVIQLLRLALGM